MLACDADTDTVYDVIAKTSRGVMYNKRDVEAGIANVITRFIA